MDAIEAITRHVLPDARHVGRYVLGLALKGIPAGEPPYRGPEMGHVYCGWIDHQGGIERQLAPDLEEP
jgi:hypothetical protein